MLRSFRLAQHRRAVARRALSCVLALAIALGCSTNPVSGRNEIVLMSEEREQELGEEAARQVEAELGLVEDPRVAGYVDALGERLARYSPRQDVEYHFAVVEMAEPNAFALPSGHVYLSRGLLVLANSEAEVANVIGHEIGHVAARHAAQRDTAAKALTLLTLLGMVGAATAGGDGRAVAAAQSFGPIALAAYSRSQEAQSDRIAQELAVRAGIDPAGMAAFLRSLDNYTRLRTGGSRLPSFLDTHPATPERLAEATTAAQTLRWQPTFSIAPTRQAYLQRIEGLVVGAPAREGVFHENHFLHADMGFALRFPHGWLQRNEHSRVMAIAPSRDAFTLLELQGAGDDPRAAAVAYTRRLGVRLSEAAPLQINGYPAFRGRARLQMGSGTADALITWIAFEGSIFRLAAGSAAGSFPRYTGILRAFARGFRKLRPQDLVHVSELRLRIARAREGETLEALSKRTGNEWDPNETAVANQLFVREPLREGEWVKIAHREPYRPQRPEPPQPPERAAGDAGTPGTGQAPPAERPDSGPPAGPRAPSSQEAPVQGPLPPPRR